MVAIPDQTVAKRPNLLIIAVALGAILNPLNTTMITVALPAIQSDFGLSSKDISWLISSYFIISAIFLPLLGKFSDFYGRKKIFITGLILVGISSFLAPFSPNMLVLLTMRGIQAIGTSALYPAGIGMVRSYVKKNQNHVIATLAVFATTSAAFGPTISGMLIQFGGWPIIFYVNFPVILVSALLALVYIPNDAKAAAGAFKWDKIGVLLFGLLIFFWVYFLQDLEAGFNILAFLLSVLLSVLFYQHEKRKAAPFINVNFLKKNLHISFIYMQYILATLIFFAMLLFMPTYLQSVLELDSKLAGMLMLAISVSSMIMTPIATRWAERSGFRIPLLFGTIVGIFGVSFLFTNIHTSSLIWICVILSVIGFSNGAMSIGLQNLLYTFVSKSDSGIASGLLMTSRFIGNILASSLYGVVFATGISDLNKNSMTVVLIIVSVVLIPGMIYVTREKFFGRQW